MDRKKTETSVAPARYLLHFNLVFRLPSQPDTRVKVAKTIRNSQARNRRATAWDIGFGPATSRCRSDQCGSSIMGQKNPCGISDISWEIGANQG